MKVEEILFNEEQLDEIKLKHAIAAGAIAVSAALPNHIDKSQDREQVKTHQIRKADVQKVLTSVEDLVSVVTDEYKISKQEAEKIVKLVKKYEKPSFPQAHDLLAVIGIESSFNPHAKSGLKVDPALGLTQIRPKMWGIKPAVLKGNIEVQIKKAVDILTHNYERLGSKDKAIHAYNVGITNVIQGKGSNLSYVAKWKNELKKYFMV